VPHSTEVLGKPDPLMGRVSLFQPRKLWALTFRWADQDWTFLGGLEFVTDFGNALWDARSVLGVEEGPYIGFPGGGDFRAHDRSVSQLAMFAGVGFGTRRREVLENKLWNMAGFALPSSSVLRARAA